MGRLASITAVYLALRRTGKTGPEILLAQRKNSGYCDGMWTLPAGHLEANEPPSLGMAREAKEELDLDLDPASLRCIHTAWRSAPDTEGGRVDFYLEPTTPIDYDSFKNMEPEKCGRLEWFPVAQPPAEIIPNVLEAVKHILNGNTFNEIYNNKV